SLSFLFLYIVWGCFARCDKRPKALPLDTTNFFASMSECANMSDRRVLKAQFRTKPKREIGCRLSLLIAEHNVTILKVVDDSQRFQTDSLFTQHLTAFLETFLDDDAAANSGCTRLCHNVQQSHQCLTFCQKIVDDQHAV